MARQKNRGAEGTSLGIVEYYPMSRPWDNTTNDSGVGKTFDSIEEQPKLCIMLTRETKYRTSHFLKG